MNKAAIKTKEFNSWMSVVPGWKKHDASLRQNTQSATARMLHLAQLKEGDTLLDIACGTGEPAIPAAQLVGRTGKVIATDWVPDMVAFAREKADRQGMNNIEFQILDGEALNIASSSVDAATIRWGLMFMPDPEACVAGAFRALKPGGRLVIANWAGPEKTPWAAITLNAIKKHVDIPSPAPGATGLYAFADPSRNRALLENAGFRSVSIEPLSVPVIDVGDGIEYFSWIKDMAGPIASLFASLANDVQSKVARDAAVDAEAHSEIPGRVRLSGITWIAAGVK